MRQSSTVQWDSVSVIYSGLFADLADQNQLAAVMAHEIEHVLSRHSLQCLFFSNGFDALAILLLGQSSATPTFLRLLATPKFNRGQEQEADVKGMKLLAAARLPPNSMVDFFRHVSKESKNENVATQLLAGHPSDEERVAILQQTVSAITPKMPIPLNVDWSVFRRRCAEETLRATKLPSTNSSFVAEEGMLNDD